MLCGSSEILTRQGDYNAHPARVGERVLAGTRFGGYAEIVNANATDTVTLPPSMSFEQGAAIPVNYATAWAALHGYGSLRAGERVLVHAAAGGVGIAVLQLAKAAGAIVHGTASPGKHDQLKALGIDRFVLVVCEALANGREIPGWARSTLPELPAIMASSDGLAGQLDHAAVSAVEAALLSRRVGEEFTATVISTAKGVGQIQLIDPAVTAACDGAATAGQVITARLVTADIATGSVRFVVVPRYGSDDSIQGRRNAVR